MSKVCAFDGLREIGSNPRPARKKLKEKLWVNQVDAIYHIVLTLLSSLLAGIASWIACSFLSRSTI